MAPATAPLAASVPQTPRETLCAKARRLNTKLFLFKRLLFVFLLLALDVRDLVYKIAWIGSADSYSFRSGVVNVLHTAPLVSAVSPERRALDAGEHVESGWSSFLSQCESLHAFTVEDGPLFLSALGTNCHLRVGHNGTRVIPQLVMTSSLRADAPTWASCHFLHVSRRPPICQDHITTHFNARYAFSAVKILNADVAAIGSDAEAEILHFLDLMSTSIPLHRVICVEAFELAPGTTSGTFTTNLYGCASPNLFQSAFVGLAAPQYQRLMWSKAWLTNDEFAVLGQRFGIRQNVKSWYEVAHSAERNALTVTSVQHTNFSSFGSLYSLMVVLDIWLVLAHCLSAFELLKWMLFPTYRGLHLWMRAFESSSSSSSSAKLVVPVSHAPQPRTSASIDALVFHEERFYAFFSASYYKTSTYIWLTRLTRVISWVIILPNSVVWTWSNEPNEKVQAYLSSIRCWVLIASAVHVLWRSVVRANEALAYAFVRRTFITYIEIVVIGALASVVLQDEIFSMCERKWNVENQRVNDVTSFLGSYIAHGNTFQRENEYRTSTPLAILHILYGPLVHIVLLSLALIFGWLLLKYAFYTALTQRRAKERRQQSAIVMSTTEVLEYSVSQHSLHEQRSASSPVQLDGDKDLDPSAHEPYARLPLEDALDIPIRAKSLIRNGLSMEVVRDGKRYIRPSCYLDYGIMLKHGTAKAQVRVADIFNASRRQHGSTRSEHASVADMVASNAFAASMPQQLLHNARRTTLTLFEAATLAGQDALLAVAGASTNASASSTLRETDDVRDCGSSPHVSTTWMQRRAIARGLPEANDSGGGVDDGSSSVSEASSDSANDARVLSRVNAGVCSIDDVVCDDERDDVVEQVNLHGNFIERMDGLEAFTRLVELCLSNNFIHTISFHALEPLVHLRILDLSANGITSTLGFPQLPHLEELSLAHNSLHALDGLTQPLKFPKLRYLDVRHNDIADYRSLVSLQSLKRLSQLRLQARDGSQSNPLCDLDDYPQPLLKLLPRLVYLDEEDVALLREVGALYMPKYHALLRRIKHRDTGGTHQRHDTSGNEDPSAASSPLRHQPTRSSRIAAAAVRRVLIRDASTNTELDLEKALLEREQALVARENAVLEHERALLARETDAAASERAASAQVLTLQDALSTALARAAKAEGAAADAANRVAALEQEQRRTHAAASASSTAADEQSKQQTARLTAELEDVREAHRRELEQRATVEANLMRTIDIRQDEHAALVRTLEERERALRDKDAALRQADARTVELTAAHEHSKRDHHAAMQQLRSDAQTARERYESAEKRMQQLELHVRELQATHTSLLTKCSEKDDALQRLQRALTAKTDDMDALKTQHAKATEQLHAIAEQQRELYRQRLETAVAHIEMEFRREHYASARKLEALQRKHHALARSLAERDRALEASRAREARAQDAIEQLQTQIAAARDQHSSHSNDDVQCVTEMLTCRTNELADVQAQLAQAEDATARAQAAAAELRAANERLERELQQQAEALSARAKLEDDLRAALKVKDVMLEHEQAQTAQQRLERSGLAQQHATEVAELQAHINDLELALDEHIEREEAHKVKLERSRAKVDALERALEVKTRDADDLSHELSKTHGALELIETEMEHMRVALSDQNRLFQTRLARHDEQHREALERALASAEDAREALRVTFEAKERELQERLARAAQDVRDVAAQNAKLRVSIETERTRNAQSDREMRVLLAEIDRERQLKRESLKHIKSLFEQLQHASSP